MTIEELIKRSEQPTPLKVRPTGKPREFKIEGVPLSKPKTSKALPDSSKR
jgi:hypothetical protein